MSQDESGTPTTLGMAATLTTEAELKARHLANNPMLRSQGLPCPKALYKEMQGDLGQVDISATVRQKLR